MGKIWFYMIFDMFFRKNACNGGYTIVCGIEQFVEYINNIHFSEDDLAYLKSLNLLAPYVPASGPCARRRPNSNTGFP